MIDPTTGEVVVSTPKFALTPDETLVLTEKQKTLGRSIDVSPYVMNRSAGQGRTLSYVSWTHVHALLQEHFPQLQVRFEVGSTGLPFFDTGRGGVVCPYLFDVETGRRTPAYFFPIMGKGGGMTSNLEFDTRAIQDSLKRGMCKMVAYYLGIGISLWEGEDIPSQEEFDRPRGNGGSTSSGSSGRSGLSMLLSFRDEHLGGSNERLYAAVAQVAPQVDVKPPQQRADGGPQLKGHYDNEECVRIHDGLLEVLSKRQGGGD